MKQDIRNTVKLRETMLRKEIKMIFDKLTMPLAVMEIKKQLADKNYFPDKSNLYRQIKTLLQQGWLKKVIVNGKTTYYEKAVSVHPHFNCTSCHEISCISDPSCVDQDLISQLKQFLIKQGFTMTGYQFVINGWCQKCHSN